MMTMTVAVGDGAVITGGMTTTGAAAVGGGIIIGSIATMTGATSHEIVTTGVIAVRGAGGKIATQGD